MRNQIGVAWIIAAVTVSCSLTAAHAQSHCGYFGLGPVPAGISSLAVALNNGDQVVIGPSSTFSSDQFPGYVWDKGVMTALGTLPGYTYVYPAAINNPGQIVGTLGNPACHGCPPPPRPAHAFLWENGIMSDLGTLEGDTTSAAVAISDSGDVAGSSAGDHGERAFLWQRGVMTALAGDTISLATGVNNRGQIVGESIGVDGQPHALVWEPDGSVLQLAPLPGDNRAYAFGINDRGQVVGYSWYFQFPNSGEPTAVVWTEGAITALGFVPGYPGSVGFAINNSGQVAGQLQSGSLPLLGFLWKEGAITVLNPLPNRQLVPTYFAINDRGDVVLNLSSNTGTDTQAYLVTPCRGR